MSTVLARLRVPAESAEAIDPHVIDLDRPRTSASTPPIGTGYHGASYFRKGLQEWLPAAGGPNTDTIPDLPTLRARSRDLARNAPVATGALNTIATSTVGTGLRLHARIDRELLGLTEDDASAWERRAERLWMAWAGNANCDVARQLSFAAMQDVVLRTQLESGDVFALRRYRQRPGDIFGLKVQLVEADRVSNPHFQMNSDRLMGGIEMDADGAPVRAHVLNQHPGEFFLVGRMFSWTAIPFYGAATGERQLLHIMRPTRAGQVRGVPILAPVIEPLKQLGRFTDAELMAAVLASFYTVFIKTEGGDTEGGLGPLDSTDTTTAIGAQRPASDYKLGHGSILDLMPGEDISTAAPGRPNDKFDPFVLAILRQVGVALEVPYEFLIKHFTASYSASRAALLEAWRAVLTRRSWLVGQFCQPCYEWLIAEAIDRGMLAAPGFAEDPMMRQAWLGAEWVGTAMGQINPVQEVQAAQQRVDGGFSSIARETAELTGGDWERTHVQRVKEHAMRVRDGLEPPVLGAAARELVGPGTPPAAPLPDPAPAEPGGATDQNVPPEDAADARELEEAGVA